MCLEDARYSADECASRVGPLWTPTLEVRSHEYARSTGENARLCRNSTERNLQCSNEIINVLQSATATYFIYSKLTFIWFYLLLFRDLISTIGAGNYWLTNSSSFLIHLLQNSIQRHRISACFSWKVLTNSVVSGAEKMYSPANDMVKFNLQMINY